MGTASTAQERESTIGSGSPRSVAADWLKDLVIYEVATKSFTSPRGPQSGTFDSLRTRLPYLEDLGITGIWLTGHSLSDSRYFYNIWTQYAAIEPDQLDPSLGTPEQFKAMVDEAHQRGIRVFLDVITHGVMSGSSLIVRHPHWFRGGSWGMVDYDWHGAHSDLDEWWVKVWTHYVVHYGIDGFRLDCDICRPDLWARIRQNCAAAGHPIVIFTEDTPLIPGVADFQQAANCISSVWTSDAYPPLSDDVPLFYRQHFVHEGSYSVRLEYADGRHSEGRTGTDSALRVEVKGFTTNQTSYQSRRPPGFSELRMTVSGVDDLRIENIIVTRLDETNVPPRSPKQWVYRLAGGKPASALRMEGRAPVLDLFLPCYGYSPSVQLSSHDNGWTDPQFAGVGFPPDKHPYVAKGSRSLFGYSFLLTPMIPIFMSGEEFDATFHAAPDLSTHLRGGKNPGEGRWLYGAQLDWSDLDQPRHRAMLEDVRRMLAIRKRERAILSAEIDADCEPRLTAVPYECAAAVPAPYLRWTQNTGIVVAGNRDSARDAVLSLHIPLERLKSSIHQDEQFRVTDLWNEGSARLYTALQLRNFELRVQRDCTERGGLAVLKIEPI